MSNQDSPLSIAASITGILTFVYALIAGVLGYAYVLRSFSNSPTDIQRFYEAFSACALESDLVRRDILASQRLLSRDLASEERKGSMADNYLLDPDSLGRLFEQVRAVEIELQNQAVKIIQLSPTGEEGAVGRLLGRGRWLSRGKELEASLGKREALTARLLVIQMSLFSARMRSQTHIVERLKGQMDAREVEIGELRLKLEAITMANGHDVEKSVIL